MADLHRFTTTSGEDVIIDLDSMIACWEGKNKDCIVFNLIGLDDPVEVSAKFDKFVTDWLDYYDCRQPKKKPRRTKQQGSPVVKLATTKDRSSRTP